MCNAELTEKTQGKPGQKGSIRTYVDGSPNAPLSVVLGPYSGRITFVQMSLNASNELARAVLGTIYCQGKKWTTRWNREECCSAELAWN